VIDITVTLVSKQHRSKDRPYIFSELMPALVLNLSIIDMIDQHDMRLSEKSMKQPKIFFLSFLFYFFMILKYMIGRLLLISLPDPF